MNRRLLLLLIPILIATCSTYPTGNPCASSAPPFSSNRPVICVSDSNLASITSAPYEAHGKRKAPIKWYTISGEGGLSIAFENEACVKRSTVNCSAGSRCDAQMVGAGTTGERCKYTVTITRNGHANTEDPVVIIDDGVYDEKQ
jgi:hypothetical protein